MFGLIKNVVNSFKGAIEDTAKLAGGLAEQGFKAGASLVNLSPASLLLDRVAKLFGAKPGNLDGQLLLPAVKPTFLEGADNPLKGTGVEGLVGQIGTLSDKIDTIKNKLADPNLSEKDRQQLQFELQTLMQERMMMITTATNTLKQDHDARMAVANNLR